MRPPSCSRKHPDISVSICKCLFYKDVDIAASFFFGFFHEPHFYVQPGHQAETFGFDFCALFFNLLPQLAQGESFGDCLWNQLEIVGLPLENVR